MKAQFKAMIARNEEVFFSALCCGVLMRIGQILESPLPLSKTEKFNEVMTLTRLIFRFDNGSFTEEDIKQSRVFFSMVPENHDAFDIARLLRHPE